MKIHPRLQLIRKNSKLQTRQHQNPEITNAILQDYTQKRCWKCNQIAKNKSNGTDGRPPETYKAIKTWIAEPITHMRNAIKNGQQQPKNWKKKGAVVHIYKNKGWKWKECTNYRTIFLLQITYKIWPNLITRRLAKILQIITDNAQYGYEKTSKLSTKSWKLNNISTKVKGREIYY